MKRFLKSFLWSWGRKSDTSIRFETLTLECRKSTEVINFSPQVSYFHGQISAGKSSIARLIDYCMGGDLEETPAISKELVSAKLSAFIGESAVIFERRIEKSNQVQVTWRDPKGLSRRVLAPIRTLAGHPIWEENIYNLSDLIFHLFGLSPIKVRLSERDPDSKLVSLSFRDLMWYCYLEQDHLDSSFFHLEAPILLQKSRYIIRFIVGAITQKLTELEAALSRIRQLKSERNETAKQLRSFLEQFGYSSDSEIAVEIEQTNSNLAREKTKLSEIQQGYVEDTHFIDGLRGKLRYLNDQLSREEQVLFDLNKKIEEQESLRAEIQTTESKLERLESAKAVLAGLSFECCPACGMKVEHLKELTEDVCPLCKQYPSKIEGEQPINKEVVKHDLDSRMEELAESLQKHSNARIAQERNLASLREEKSSLDKRLDEELKNYDSRFLARSRDIERRIATYEERTRSLKRILEMPIAVSRLEKEADALSADEDGLKRRIQNEKASIEASERCIQDIEDSFLQCMLAVGVPGVEEGDKVQINRTTWIPDILIGGNETMKWNFFNAGSAGKKTLLNACYALAIHAVAAQHGLPLPTFLIIDTPMKNIGEDVNRDLFEAFYTHLYNLAQGPLSNTQFVIIDKEYFPPRSKEIKINERYMTQADAEHPPLISYYRGP